MASDSSPDLNEVQRALQQHRRDVGRGRIPDTLRRCVLDLLPVYSRKQVVNTLSISYKMLCSWERDQQAAVRPVSSPAMDFVRVPLAEDRKASLPAVSSSASASLPTEIAVTALELRFDADTVLTFTGDSASTHCLSLLRGLGYGRRPLTDVSA